MVEVAGVSTYARAADAEEIAATRPSRAVRLLPAFDQYVLGPGTQETAIIAAPRRPLVSRAAGWISPVVVAAGGVVGTWEATTEALEVALFPEAGFVDGEALAEGERLAGILGRKLRLSVRWV